jgi:hypothetical protein
MLMSKNEFVSTDSESHLRPTGEPAARESQTDDAERPRAAGDGPEGGDTPAAVEPSDRDDQNQCGGIGYGRPPRANRFQAGQSGNPSGRPKGSKNKKTLARPLFELVLEAAEVEIDTDVGGERKPILTVAAILQAVAARAVAGDSRSQQFFLNTYHDAQQWRAAQLRSADHSWVDVRAMSPDEREVFKAGLLVSQKYRRSAEEEEED